MDVVKKVLRKIKRTPKPVVKLEHPLVKLIAEYKAREYKREFWERDKKNMRDQNFKKALLALEKKRELQNLEKERQTQIAENRLKNLKKARRKLKRMREDE